MATTMKRLPARTSATLRATIDQAGPVSAATRALLWLGADAAGLQILTGGKAGDRRAPRRGGPSAECRRGAPAPLRPARERRSHGHYQRSSA